MIKRHVHVKTLLGNIQIPGLPVCQRRY